MFALNSVLFDLLRFLKKKQHIFFPIPPSWHTRISVVQFLLLHSLLTVVSLRMTFIKQPKTAC